MYEGTCIQIQPPSPDIEPLPDVPFAGHKEKKTEVQPPPIPPDCEVPAIYDPVCALFDGDMVEFGNEYHAECVYVSFCMSFSLSLCLCECARLCIYNKALQKFLCFLLQSGKNRDGAEFLLFFAFL